LEILQSDYEKKIKGAHMDMLKASTVKSTPMDSKVNVERGSDINDIYEEDMPEKDDKVTTKYGVVELFTRSDIEFMHAAT
jgi:hypothetical protein